MARLPSWRDQIPQSYVGARKWGTGINPIHGQRTGYEGRNLAPGTYDPVDTGLVNLDFGYVDEDYIPGVDLRFMDTHPNLSDPSIRGTSDLPPWGNGRGPGPQGNLSRIIKKGLASHDVNQVPNGIAAEGWENKVTGPLLNSGTADEAQLYVQTSMRQRDAVRNNTSAITRGTDDPREDIASRIPGMRVKVWPGGYRHVDMEPKAQDYRTRPWRYRSAGTGDVSWMTANEWRSTEPIRREIPPDVDQGTPENSVSDDVYDDWF